MKEIGGYIELDRNRGSLYHDEAIALNCGRACLEYLIQAKQIKKLYIPYFCCGSIVFICQKCNIEFEYYHIDEKLLPVFNKVLDKDEYLYFVNYYGQTDNDTFRYYITKFRNIIIDNVMAYFQERIEGIDTLTSCRKYFGVSDGGFLYTNSRLNGLEQDESFERIHYLLGRFERSAEEFYAEASKNNKIFRIEPLKTMSKLTKNLLRGIDYEFVIKRRTENFEFLHTQLKDINKLKLVVPIGAFMYPLYIENGESIRKSVQGKKIFIPTLWPDVFNVCKENELEYDMAKNILPLPIDQRYGEDDMEYLVNEIRSCLR